MVLFGLPDVYKRQVQELSAILSMDFWASMEHRINYKKERQDREKLVKELKEHARKLEKIEKSFEKYSENVQNSVS